MNGSFADSVFGTGSHGFTAGKATEGIMQAMDQLRSAFDQRTTTPRMQKGDVRAAVLSLLAEQPMHGYQIIRELSERSGGVWRPSPGSVYPTLQQLEDEDLVHEQRPEGGRRTYELTDAGREAAAALPEAKPWEQAGEDVGDDAVALHDLVHQVLGATRQVLQAGTPEQVKAAQEVLRDARKSLYKILADD